MIYISVFFLNLLIDTDWYRKNVIRNKVLKFYIDFKHCNFNSCLRCKYRYEIPGTHTVIWLQKCLMHFHWKLKPKPNHGYRHLCWHADPTNPFKICKKVLCVDFFSGITYFFQLQLWIMYHSLYFLDVYLYFLFYIL